MTGERELLGARAWFSALLKRLDGLAPGALSSASPTRGHHEPAGLTHRIPLVRAGEDVGVVEVGLALAQVMAGLIVGGAVRPPEVRPLVAVEEAAIDSLVAFICADAGLAADRAMGSRRREDWAAPACVDFAVRLGTTAGSLRLSFSETGWEALAAASHACCLPPYALEIAVVAPNDGPLGLGDAFLPADWSDRPSSGVLRGDGPAIPVALDWHANTARLHGVDRVETCAAQAPPAPASRVLLEVGTIAFTDQIRLHLGSGHLPFESDPIVVNHDGSRYRAHWVRLRGRVGVRLTQSISRS